MKPSELLRAALEVVEKQDGEAATCIEMKSILTFEGVVDDYWSAKFHPVFLAARKYLYNNRTAVVAFISEDVFFDNGEERIEGITKAIADAEAAGE